MCMCVDSCSSDLDEVDVDSITFDDPQHTHLKVTEEIKERARLLAGTPERFLRHPLAADEAEFNHILLLPLI